MLGQERKPIHNSRVYFQNNRNVTSNGEKTNNSDHSYKKEKVKHDKLALPCLEWKAKRKQGNENKIRLKIEKPK